MEKLKKSGYFTSEEIAKLCSLSYKAGLIDGKNLQKKGIE